MKVLKKLQLHHYSVLDNTMMKEIRGGFENRAKKECAEYDEATCSGKCRTPLNERGRCKLVEVGYNIPDYGDVILYTQCACTKIKEEKE